MNVNLSTKSPHTISIPENSSSSSSNKTLVTHILESHPSSGASLSGRQIEPLSNSIGSSGANIPKLDEEALHSLDIETLEKTLEPLLSEFPQDLNVQFWKCRLLVQKRELKFAMQLLQSLIDRSETLLPELLLLRAQILAEENISPSPDVHISIFFNLFKMYPNHPEVVAGTVIFLGTRPFLFEIYSDEKKKLPNPTIPENIQQTVEELLKLHPQNPRLLFAKGIILFFSKNYSEALNWFNKSLKKTPHGLAYIFKAYALFELSKDSSEAQFKACERTLSPFIWYLHGILSYRPIKVLNLPQQSKEKIINISTEALKTAFSKSQSAEFSYSLFFSLIQMKEWNFHSYLYTRIIKLQPFTDANFYLAGAVDLLQKNDSTQAFQLLEQLITRLNDPQDFSKFIKHRHHHLGDCANQAEWKKHILFEAYILLFKTHVARCDLFDGKSYLEIGSNILEKAVEQLPCNSLNSKKQLLYIFTYVKLLILDNEQKKVEEVIKKFDSLGILTPQLKSILNNSTSEVMATIDKTIKELSNFDVSDFEPKKAPVRKPAEAKQQPQITNIKTLTPEEKAELQLIIARQRQDAEEKEHEKAKKKLGQTTAKVGVKPSVQEQPVGFLEDKPTSEKQPRAPHVLKKVAKQQEILNKLGQKKAQDPKTAPMQAPPAPAVEQPPAPPTVQTITQTRSKRQPLSGHLEHVLDLRHLQIHSVEEIKRPDAKKIAKTSKTERKVSNLSEALTKRLQTAKDWLIFLGDQVARFDAQDASKFRLNAMFSILKLSESLCDTSSGCWQALRLSETIVEALSGKGRIIEEVQLKINAQLAQLLQSLTSIEPQKNDNLALTHEIQGLLKTHPMQMMQYCQINMQLREVLQRIPHTNTPVDRLIDETLEELPLQLTLEELKSIDQQLIVIDHLNILRNEIRSYFLFASNTQILALAKALSHSSLKDNLQAWIKSDQTAAFSPRVSALDLPLLCQTEDKKEWDKVLAVPSDASFSILFKLMQENFQMIEELIQIKSDFKTFWLQGAEVQSAISMGLSNIRKCLVFFRNHNLLYRFIPSDEYIENTFKEFITLGNKLGHNIEDVPSESIFEIAKKSKLLGESFNVIQKEQFPASIILDISLTAAQLVRLRAHFPKENSKQFKWNLSLFGGFAKRFSKESFVEDLKAQEMAKNLLSELKREILKFPDATCQHLLNIIFNESPQDSQKLYALVLQAKVLMNFLFPSNSLA